MNQQLNTKAGAGYVVASQVYSSRWESCGKLGCMAPGEWRACKPPQAPAGVFPTCSPSRQLMEQHPDYFKAYDQWVSEHRKEHHTGGTRLGPFHYFSDCNTLLHKGPRRADARIVALDHDVAKALNLPTCKACATRMAELEKLLVGEPAAVSQSS